MRGEMCYIGETSKPAYTRYQQHFNNYKTAAAAKLAALPNPRLEKETRIDVKSWMWEHTRDVHGGVVGPNEVMGDCIMKVTGMFRRCLERQVTEGISITKCEQSGGKLLNSKKRIFYSQEHPDNFQAMVKSSSVWHCSVKPPNISRKKKTE